MYIMKKHHILYAFICVAVLGLLVGCSKSIEPQSLLEYGDELKSVNAESKFGYVRFEYMLPEDWDVTYSDFYSVWSFNKSIGEITPASAIQIDACIPQYGLLIDNYEHRGDAVESISAKEKKAYKELFRGNTQAYKEVLETEYMKDNELMLYSKVLAANDGITEMPEFIPKDSYVSDYSVEYYAADGFNIAVVKYSYDLEGIIYKCIDCIRDDMPYFVRGGFDDTLSVSSGDYALLVASTMTVEEDYELTDGWIK